MAAFNSTDSTAPRATQQYALTPGVRLAIDPGQAEGYARMRATQLSALLAVIALAKDCEHTVLDDSTLDDANWLAASLAGEMINLIGVVAKDREARHPAAEPA